MFLWCITRVFSFVISANDCPTENDATRSHPYCTTFNGGLPETDVNETEVVPAIRRHFHISPNNTVELYYKKGNTESCSISSGFTLDDPRKSSLLFPDKWNSTINVVLVIIFASCCLCCSLEQLLLYVTMPSEPSHDAAICTNGTKRHRNYQTISQNWN